MTHYVNGPINVIRLEGTLFNIKKIIYIYFDHHYDIKYQTKCEDFLADDITTYLNKEFIKNHDKVIDFFVEGYINLKNLYLDNISKKERYIDEVNKFFFKNILIQDNKNLGTKINKNIRFHYIDIRQIFKFNFYKIFNQLEDVIKNNIDYKSYKYIIDLINSKLDELKNIIKNNDNNLIDKLKFRYNHAEIKNKINVLLDKFDKDIDILKFNMINIKNLDDLQTYEFELIQILAWLMDIYFLRRFLDKDYITNGVVYCGIGHAIRYIIILIKDFGFEITHFAYLEKPMSMVNQIIKNMDDNNLNDLEEIRKIFIKNKQIQCVDLSNFPDNLE
jgi:hypothetical protein